MSAEQNKSIVRRWIEDGWNKHNLAVIDEVYAPNFVQHEPEPQTVNSSEALKQYVGAEIRADILLERFTAIDRLWLRLVLDKVWCIDLVYHSQIVFVPAFFDPT